MNVSERVIGRSNLRTVVHEATRALKAEGFSIISEITIASESENSNADTREYPILLVCNPVLAYKAVSLDSRTGVLLTGRIAFREHDNGTITVSVFNPLECMDENMATSPLEEVSVEVTHHLHRAIARLQLSDIN